MDAEDRDRHFEIRLGAPRGQDRCSSKATQRIELSVHFRATHPMPPKPRICGEMVVGGVSTVGGKGPALITRLHCARARGRPLATRRCCAEPPAGEPQRPSCKMPCKRSWLRHEDSSGGSPHRCRLSGVVCSRPEVRSTALGTGEGRSRLGFGRRLCVLATTAAVEPMSEVPMRSGPPNTPNVREAMGGRNASHHVTAAGVRRPALRAANGTERRGPLQAAWLGKA